VVGFRLEDERPKIKALSFPVRAPIFQGGAGWTFAESGWRVCRCLGY